jgi:hypothetical protein
MSPCDEGTRNPAPIRVLGRRKPSTGNSRAQRQGASWLKVVSSVTDREIEPGP